MVDDPAEGARIDEEEERSDGLLETQCERCGQGIVYPPDDGKPFDEPPPFCWECEEVMRYARARTARCALCGESFEPKEDPISVVVAESSTHHCEDCIEEAK